jgi:hypothetical protein
VGLTGGRQWAHCQHRSKLQGLSHRWLLCVVRDSVQMCLLSLGSLMRTIRPMRAGRTGRHWTVIASGGGGAVLLLLHGIAGSSQTWIRPWSFFRRTTRWSLPTSWAMATPPSQGGTNRWATSPI